MRVKAVLAVGEGEAHGLPGLVGVVHEQEQAAFKQGQGGPAGGARGGEEPH